MLRPLRPCVIRAELFYLYFLFGGIDMIKVTLKGDVVKEFPKGITAFEVAKGHSATPHLTFWRRQ